MVAAQAMEVAVEFVGAAAVRVVTQAVLALPGAIVNGVQQVGVGEHLQCAEERRAVHRGESLASVAQREGGVHPFQRSEHQQSHRCGVHSVSLEHCL